LTASGLATSCGTLCILLSPFLLFDLESGCRRLMTRQPKAVVILDEEVLQWVGS
jgi:hypothetical protein